MSMYLELTYIDSNDAGRKTGAGAEGKTDQWAIDAFNAARKYEEPIKTCSFLLDLMNDNREVIDTIGLSLEGFEAITGEKPKGEKEYIEFDSNFWAGCQMLSKAHKAGNLEFETK